MSAVPRMVFNGEWATLPVRRALPGFEQPNAGLAAYIIEQDAREADYTARYQEQNFFASDNPAVRWLKGQIAASLEQCVIRSGEIVEKRVIA